MIIAGCSDDKSQPEATLSVNPDIGAIEFSEDGKTAYAGGKEIEPVLSVNTNQESWDVVVKPEESRIWLKSGKSSDNTKFTVGAKTENASGAVKTATVTVTAGDATPVVIRVTQQTITFYKVGNYWPDPNVVYKGGKVVSGTAAKGIVYWLDDQHKYYNDGSSEGGDATGSRGKIVSLEIRPGVTLKL